MNIEIRVALIGDPTNLKSDILPRRELMRAYADRRVVALEIDENSPIEDVFVRAAQLHGLTGWAARPTRIGFYRPEDATSVPPMFSLFLPVIQDNGEARWSPPPHHYPYRFLLRAAEEGFLYGDPLRPHIAMVPPVGDGVLPDWPTIAHSLELLKTVGEILAVPGGVVATWQIFRKSLAMRSTEAAEAIEGSSPIWQERGAGPWVFEEWLSGGAWKPNQISSHLGCSDEQAEAVLWAFGFAEDQDGKWRQGVSEEAQFLADNMRMMIRMSISQAEDRQIIEEFESRARELVRTGKAPEIDWQTLDWLKPTSVVEEGPGTRIGRMRHRLVERISRYRR